MPLIIETEKDIDKKLNVSDPYGNLSNELVAAYASIQTDKKNGEANGQNIKRIEGLAKNVLGYDKDEDPSETSIHLKSEQPKNALNISKRQVKKALHDIGKLPQDQRGKYGNLVTKIEHVFANALKGNRNANKITKQFQPNNIKPQKPQNADDSSIKPLKAQNGTQIHIINENFDDRHPFYDYLEEYSHYNIFDWFENDKRDNNGKNTIWFPRINPNEYQQALDYLSKFGELPKPLQNKPYQWFGIIMKNTAILANCTDLCGHSSYFPKDDFLCYFFSDDENGEWEEWLNEKGLEDDDFYPCSEYLNEIGFYDWCVLPDGSDAMSDYGMQPLLKIIKEYNDNLSPEQVLVLVNKALDVYHMRGDLSSMFIQGGKKFLSQISNSHLHENKKIILKENQINVLKEYINQLQIPFEEFGDEYGKEPYDYYMDFIEEVSEKGTLPPSNITIYDILKYIINQDGFFLCVFNTLYNNQDYELFADNIFYLMENEPYCFNRKFTQQEITFYENNFEKQYEKILNCFTKKGLYRLFEKSFGSLLVNEKKFKNNELKGNEGLLNKLIINENGLIYVERVVSIPFNPKYHPKYAYGYGYDKSSSDSLKRHKAYYQMKHFFSHFGTCWTWLKNGGENFAKSDFFTEKDSSLVFKGFVNPKDVNWASTLINSLVEYTDEYELTINEGADIQINEIIWLEENKKLPLHQPIIVKA